MASDLRGETKSSWRQTDSCQPRLFIRVAERHRGDGEGDMESRLSENHSDPNSFHRAVSSVLVIAQMFALMPVEGITSANPTHLRFRWFNGRMLYTLWTQLCYLLLIVAYLYLQQFTEEKSMLKKYMIIVFLGCGLTNSILFVILARRWPTLMTRLHRLELAMEAEYGYPERLASRCRNIAIVVLSVSLCEHFLSNYKTLSLSYDCAENLAEWIHVYYSSKPVCSLINGYNLLTCAVFQQMSLVAVFSWNFMDLFVALLGVMLTSRLRQITQRLETIRNREMPPFFWSQVREDYAKVVDFVKIFDEHVNKIVLLCVGNSLYFICLQLLHSIGTNDEQTTLYFYVSFGHLLLRTCTMGIFVAGIHEESRQPAAILFSVPSTGFTSEVERLLQQVTSDSIALTGSNFFSVTKAMLLTLAGTIITYEIVLVQLAPDEQHGGTTIGRGNFTGFVNPLCPGKNI